METYEEGRSARKHKAIMEAATEAFLSKGYQGTSMEEVATLAGVSKQTVYKHFADKERLFAEIVLATTGEIDKVVELAAAAESGTGDLDKDLTELATRFLTALMQPRPLQLRRLVIANAERFPQLGTLWYERGFERVLATLATSFKALHEEGKLHVDDPLTAANHFAGLLLWIPLNRAMFSGGTKNPTEAELQHHAETAAHTFLNAYRPTPSS